MTNHTNLSGSQFISRAANRIDTSEIRKVFDLAANIKNPLNLSIGQPDFPVPQEVKESFIQAIRDDKNAYTPTQGILPLREAISEKWKTQNGFEVSPENVIVSAGVASLLMLLYEAIFNEGDQILLTDPYFLIYGSLASFHNLDVRFIPEDFSAEDMKALASDSGFNPKCVIFSSPSNPSGRILSREQLQALSDYARTKNCILISDEIYEAYDYDKQFISMASIDPEYTITLGGFSKSHAMTGLRVGYMGVPSNLTPIFQKVAALQQYSIVCSPQPAQWAAVTALEVSIDKQLETMKKRRGLVKKTLEGKVDIGNPAGAFYAFARIPIDSTEFIKQAIDERLLIVPGYIFSKNSNTVRLSYAVSEDILKEGLDTFLKLIEKNS